MIWERKIKRGARVLHASRPDPAAVPVNDALEISQPDARALKIGTVMTLSISLNPAGPASHWTRTAPFSAADLEHVQTILLVEERDPLN